MRTARTYGWNRDLPDHRDLVRVAAPEQLAALPPRVDLRNDPHMPAVYDQQQIGSCTGNGIAGAVEYLLRKENLADFVPSRLFIYYNERKMEHNTGYDAGGQIRDGVRSIARQGVCPETEWPYDGRPANSDGSWPAGHRAGERPTDACYTAARKTEAVVYERVPQQADQLKAVLAGGDLVVFGFTVFSSFESAEVARTGEAPMPGPGDSPVGGHCVVLVGYDDDLGRWICRNSWGAGWGRAGYFTLPYGYLVDARLASDFWTIRRVS